MQLSGEWEALGGMLCAHFFTQSSTRPECLLVKDHGQLLGSHFMQPKLLGLAWGSRGLGLFPESGESSESNFSFLLALAI